MANLDRSIMRAIYAMGFANFAAGMSVLIIAGVLTELATDIRVSTGQAGQLISIYSLSYAIGAPLLMAVTSRYERRIMLTLALVLIFIGNGAAAFGSDYLFLMIVRIVTALGAAAYTPLSAASAISLVPPAERGKVTAIVFTGFTLATAMGLPIGTYIGLNFGWRFSVGTVAILALVAAYLLWRELPHDINTPAVNLAVFGQVFRNSLLVVVLSVTILQFAGQMAIFAFVSPLLQAFTTLDATGISFMLLLNGVGGVFGNYIGGLAADRFGARVTQLVMIVVLAVCLAMLPLIAQNLLIGGILMLVWGSVGQGFIAPQLVRIVTLDPLLSSASLSLNSSFINVGLSFGAIAGGFFIDNVGVWSLTWLGVGGTLLSICVFGLSWVMENSRNRGVLTPA